MMEPILNNYFAVKFAHNIKKITKIGEEVQIGLSKDSVDPCSRILNVAQFEMHRDLIIKQVCLFG